MRRCIRNNKGQAAAELAILGVLLIVAFSYVMNFGQSLGKTQQVKMESFRRALQKAYVKNGSVSYTLRHNTSQATMNASFFQGQPSTVEGSGSVTWAKGQRGPMGSGDEGSYAYWRLNKFETELPTRAQYQYGPTGAESDEKIKTPVSIYQVAETRTGDYNLNSNKQEADSGITYTKTAQVTDRSAGILHTRFNVNVDKNPGDDRTPTPDYHITNNVPFIDTKTYNYNQSWVVPND